MDKRLWELGIDDRGEGRERGGTVCVGGLEVG